MTHNSNHYDRVIIGGGIFGSFAALHLAKLGYRVLLIDSDFQLLNRASFVNQARLHTGLHYPRSLLTAQEALKYYSQFRNKFSNSIRDFKQIYAVSQHNSKTSGKDFGQFIERLGVASREIDPSNWFLAGSVSCAYEVEEPSFDAAIIRKQLQNEIESSQKIDVLLGTKVVGSQLDEDSIEILLSDDSRILSSGIVIAAYTATNEVRKILNLEMLPIEYELAEVLLGKTTTEMANIGFTIMDGPFWSLMPFGKSNFSTLTSVGLTPIARNSSEPRFSCQSLREGCTSSHLADCNNCAVRPHIDPAHHVQQMSIFLKSTDFFQPQSSLLTIKSVLASSAVDDARPTLIKKEIGLNIWTIFSGKVSTLFDIEEALI